MLYVRKPTEAMVRQFLNSQAGAKLTYSEVGASLQEPPANYNVDHTRVRLGTGKAAFTAARAALSRWEQFQLGWLFALPMDTPIVPGNDIAVAAHILGLWWLNAARIVYVIDETGPISRFGFAYGTLPQHAEQGEERFLVEWDQADDSVSYDILAFSRPRHLLAWAGYPLTRRLQKRFGRESATAMRRTVAGHSN